MTDSRPSMILEDTGGWTRVAAETDVCVVGVCGASADSMLCSAGLPAAWTARMTAAAKKSTRMMSDNVVTCDRTICLCNFNGSMSNGAM